MWRWINWPQRSGSVSTQISETVCHEDTSRIAELTIFPRVPECQDEASGLERPRKPERRGLSRARNRGSGPNKTKQVQKGKTGFEFLISEVEYF